MIIVPSLCATEKAHIVIHIHMVKYCILAYYGILLLLLNFHFDGNEIIGSVVLQNYTF